MCRFPQRGVLFVFVCVWSLFLDWYKIPHPATISTKFYIHAGNTQGQVVGTTPSIPQITQPFKEIHCLHVYVGLEI